ncbi:MAG: hypothetical protein HLUCCA12_05385 [Rhodobacteraceae bacterium HLUCCA12]|nr:MAG: hypothetical protein HLUCCA12_05385 [Rhodobacteraceae bacterium HLUCCA12]
MLRLMMILFLFIGVTLAGIGVVAALSMGLYETRAIVLFAASGAVLGLVVSWLVARRLQEA